jgi:hypothetical protein
MKKLIFRLTLIFVFSGISLGGVLAQGGLFKSKDPLPVELSFSIKQLRSETNDSTYIDSKMIYEVSPGVTDTLDIEIRTRGNFRLDNCFYPPMRVKMKKDDIENTLFKGDRSLKLVLPCSKSKTADSFLGKEYLSYKLYEEATPYFFRTRLLRVKFVNSDEKKGEAVELLGFFIEDDDEVADRFDGEILDGKKIIPTLMEDTATVRHDFFQMMIGNTDWSGLFQHNQKVMKLDERTVVPIAYDFDMTGLVNPPYAQVNTSVGIERVTDRVYRGFCRDPELMQTIRQEFLAKEDRILELVNEYKAYYSEADLKAVSGFLKEFFDVLKSDKLFKQQILDKCRKADGSQSF